jgi:ZIP family zinc transporter
MDSLSAIILYTAAAGACIPLGGILASVERIQPRWLETEVRYFIIALGGGILLGAVALVLVPAGTRHLDNPAAAVAMLITGGLLFFLLEWLLGRSKRESPQLTGMLLDYLPESMALGGLMAVGQGAAPLLALLIGLQNLPEGFNAFRELNRHEHNARKTLTTMALLVPLGPFFGVVGYLFLDGYRELLGSILLIASGGILYLIFQDIAPQAKLRRHWAPPLGAVFGFALALTGSLLVGHG